MFKCNHKFKTQPKINSNMVMIIIQTPCCFHIGISQENFSLIYPQKTKHYPPSKIIVQCE